MKARGFVNIIVILVILLLLIIPLILLKLIGGRNISDNFFKFMDDSLPLIIKENE